MMKENKTTLYLVVAGLLLGANIVHYFVLPASTPNPTQRPLTNSENPLYGKQSFVSIEVPYRATRHLFEPVRPPVIKPIIAKPSSTPDKTRPKKTSKFNQLKDLKFLGSLTKGGKTYAFITLTDKEMTLKTGDKITPYEDFIVTRIERSYIEIGFRDSKERKLFGGVE